MSKHKSAKLYFNYGTMGSSKSANALMTYHNYLTLGQKPLLAKPEIDTREQNKVVKSRVGIEFPCIFVSELLNMADISLEEYDCIIVDEAQFLTKSEVDRLVYMVDDLKIPVICYGLRTDFQGNLFDGSKRLMEMADKISEIKTVCWCGRKAIMNARFNDSGEVIRDGKQIEIGADEKYIGLCREHWKQGKIKK